ncbi:MAG: hypothetical protein KBA51_08405 [Kiritimatiellae bacterium]|nr:hypothetical protein [Kiritimatiellia bacterium]
MTTSGWIFMIVSWSLVFVMLAYCFFRVLKSKQHWTDPGEDIRELHHGEFNDTPPPNA